EDDAVTNEASTLETPETISSEPSSLTDGLPREGYLEIFRYNVSTLIEYLTKEKKPTATMIEDCHEKMVQGLAGIPDDNAQKVAFFDIIRRLEKGLPKSPVQRPGEINGDSIPAGDVV